MNDIIVIVGPTGVGKTKLSIELAKMLDAEIINGDSVSIYKKLDIGSAKPSLEERDGVVHHLIDIRNVLEDYSVYDYQKDVRDLIKDIDSRGKRIIIVGGTGLYIKSALYDYELEDNDNNNETYDGISTEELYQELINLDKDINIDKYNRRRVVRALNYYKHNGKSISLNTKGNKLLYDTIFIGLTMENREKLYSRINDRVDDMIKNGLVEEVKHFYDLGIRTKPLLSGIGYKELYMYFDNEISYEEAIDLIKKKTRHYAKRQYTFFNHQFKMKWFNTNISNFNNTIDEVYDYIKKETNI